MTTKIQAGGFLLAAAALAGQVAAADAQRGPQAMPADATPVAVRDAAAPSATISNGLVTAKIYLPDAKKGFYRGTRFDWAGVVGSLTYEGQDFYGPWFDAISPNVHDHVYVGGKIISNEESGAEGPVEEFDTGTAALGFDEAAPGGTFVKIGIGILKRPDAAPYDFSRHYEIVDGGKRIFAASRNSTTFTQRLDAPVLGYGYVYTKTLRLVPGKPELVIEHRLRNTGRKAISTNLFDHNFLNLSPGNANIQVTMPFKIVTDRPPPTDLAKIDGNRLIYVRPMTGKDVVFFPVKGFSPNAKGYEIRWNDTRTGAGLSVKADQPLSAMNVWSIRTVQAVEPYIQFDLAPGAEKSWTYTYDYRGPAKVP